MIELTFADQNVRVVAVGDGQLAIDRIAAEPPDIVLADVGMPTRDGYEVAAFVKSTPRLAHIPVLLLTGAFEPVDEIRARAAGCDGLLVKPFEPQMVIARVKALLAGRGHAIGGSQDVQAHEPAVADEPGAAADPLDAYFDRLDKAFARLADGPQAPIPALDDQASEFDDRRTVTLADPPPAAAPISVADAFNVLLSAERGEGPALAPRSAGGAGSAANDDLVETVVTRVLQRMSDALVRARVDEIVSGIAERVVREEIDRIKASGDRRPPR